MAHFLALGVLLLGYVGYTEAGRASDDAAAALEAAVEALKDAAVVRAVGTR